MGRTTVAPRAHACTIMVRGVRDVLC